MINKVTIEGDVTRGTWGKGEQSGYFIIIKQTNSFNKFKTANYFSLYANHPLAKTLSETVEKNPATHIVVEGELKTYYSKKVRDWKVSILITKILSAEAIEIIEPPQANEPVINEEI